MRGGHRLGARRAHPGGRDGLRRRRVGRPGPGAGVARASCASADAPARALAPVDGARRRRRGGARLRLRHRRDRAARPREARGGRRGALGDGHARAEPGARDPQPAQRRGPAAPPAGPARRQARHRRRGARGAPAQGADRRRRDRAPQPPAHRVPRARPPARRRCASSCTSASSSSDVLDLEQGSAAGAPRRRSSATIASDCVLVGDPEKLKQVVLNLVVNALEAMKEGGTLRVRVASSGDEVRLVVDDTGAGHRRREPRAGVRPVLHDEGGRNGPRASRSCARSSTSTAARCASRASRPSARA